MPQPNIVRTSCNLRTKLLYLSTLSGSDNSFVLAVILLVHQQTVLLESE